VGSGENGNNGFNKDNPFVYDMPNTGVNFFQVNGAPYQLLDLGDHSSNGFGVSEMNLTDIDHNVNDLQLGSTHMFHNVDQNVIKKMKNNDGYSVPTRVQNQNEVEDFMKLQRDFLELKNIVLQNMNNYSNLEKKYKESTEKNVELEEKLNKIKKKRVRKNVSKEEETNEFNNNQNHHKNDNLKVTIKPTKDLKKKTI